MNGLRRQAFNRFLNDASGRQYTMRTRLKTLYLTSVLMTLRGAAPLAAQSTLQITSPSNGAILNPGQMLSVTVNASGSFQVVTVLGEGTIGFGQQLSAPPYQFSTQIPARASAGIYKLTAVGANSTGQPVFSVPVSIDIEPTANMGGNILVTPGVLEFHVVGDQVPLVVTARFSDGSRQNLTHSTATTYASDAPSVAAVDSMGLVTAVSTGSATITVNGAFRIPVTVLRPVSRK
jgi:hypothetical protein